MSGATDADGKLDLSTLIVGEYKLVETKAPAGYQAGTAQYSTIPGSVESINSDGTFKVTAGDLTKDKGLGVLVTNKKSGHTVTYDKNGGVEVSGTVEDLNSPYANGDFWTVLGANGILTWDGHYFTGWNTAQDGTGKRYPVGATYICNDKDGDIYLYAQWKEKSPKAIASPNVTKAFTTDSDDRPAAKKANFEFDIEQTGGTDVEGLTDSATQNDAGTLTSPFGDRIMFPGVGTYTFKISEKNTGVSGYTYDDTTYTWTVVVFEPGVADASYTPTGYEAKSTLVNDKTGAVVTEAEFNNKFTSGSEVRVGKVADKVDAAPGQNIDYTITVANTGESKVVGVWVKDTIPAGTSFVSCDDAGVVSDDKTYVNWFVPELEPGATVTFDLVVRVNDNVQDALQITNTAKYEVTANPVAPDFRNDPQGEDTPTASTKVETAKASSVSQAKAVSTSAKSAATGDNALPLGLVAVFAVVAGCVAYVSRRRGSSK